MSRRSALKLFGLDESASNAARWAAYSALRAHLESRARAASAMERPGALAFFREQLRGVDDAFWMVTGQPAAQSVPQSVTTTEPSLANTASVSRSNSDLRRWALRGAALVAGLVLLAAGMISFGLLEQESAAPAGVDSMPGKASPAALAQIRLRGNLDGAVARVVTKASGETIWQGPADGQPHAVLAGDYLLVVEHPSCPGSWKEQVQLAPGQQLERLGRNCEHHGLLAVSANQDGARLSIDGRLAGVPDGGETALSVGQHQIRVEHEGYESWEALIDLAPASRVSLQARLSPSPEAPVQSTPAVARLTPRVATSEQEVDRRTHEWHRSAKQYLLARYDADRSGHLDSPAEIESIPCGDWRGLEQSFDAGGLALSMTRFYGFDGSKWIEDAFGVSSAMRGETYRTLKRCGLR